MTPLQIFPRHPESPDTYYINGAWAPAAITAVDKRFSDGELAAEYHAANAAAWRLTAFRSYNRDEVGRVEYEFETFRRFATLPHHDADPA